MSSKQRKSRRELRAEAYGYCVHEIRKSLEDGQFHGAYSEWADSEFERLRRSVQEIADMLQRAHERAERLTR